MSCDHIGDKMYQVHKQEHRPCSMRIDRNASGEAELVFLGDGARAFSYLVPAFHLQSIIDRLCEIRDFHEDSAARVSAYRNAKEA